MIKERFIILEHKEKEHVFDTENTPSYHNPNTDFIELLGDSLTTTEIVELLNSLNHTNKDLRLKNKRLEIDILNATLEVKRLDEMIKILEDQLLKEEVE